LLACGRAGGQAGLTPQAHAHGAAIHVCPQVRSKNFQFRYHPSAETVHFLSYGDMGVKNSGYTARLAAKDAASGLYDLVVNVGDTSYADDYTVDHNAQIFDEHFRETEPYAANMFFMTVAGNHERQYNFAGTEALRTPHTAHRTAATTRGGGFLGTAAPRTPAAAVCACLRACLRAGLLACGRAGVRAGLTPQAHGAAINICPQGT